MSNVLDRLRKKHGSPVVINGETFHVRSLNLGELRRLDALTPDNKTGFLVGCALCTDETGEPAFSKLPEETDAEWAAGVLKMLDDVPTETIRALSDGVAAIGRVPKLETVAKN
jgi:hypothetical protein